MKESFEEEKESKMSSDEQWLNSLSPELKKEVLAKREKKKTIIIAIVFILIVSYGIWCNHFRNKDKDNMEQPVTVMTPQDRSYYDTTPHNSEVSPEEKELEDKVNQMIDGDEWYDYLNNAMDSFGK